MARSRSSGRDRWPRSSKKTSVFFGAHSTENQKLWGFLVAKQVATKSSWKIICKCNSGSPKARLWNIDTKEETSRGANPVLDSFLGAKRSPQDGFYFHSAVGIEACYCCSSPLQWVWKESWNVTKHAINYNRFKIWCVWLVWSAPVSVKSLLPLIQHVASHWWCTTKYSSRFTLTQTLGAKTENSHDDGHGLRKTFEGLECNRHEHL